MKPVVLVALFAVACGAVPKSLPSGSAPAGDELFLYRDFALMKQRISVVVPEAGKAKVTLIVPAGIATDDITILGTDGTSVSSISNPIDVQRVEEQLEEHLDDEGYSLDDGALRKLPDPPPQATTTAPTPVTFEVGALQAGTYALTVAYVTDRLPWTAAYTMITSPARTHATLRGALAIRNNLGAPLAHVRTFVVDTDLAPWRGHVAELIAEKTQALPKTPVAQLRLLGDLDLAVGESRIELLPQDAPRAMHSVLVYDPIGTSLDVPVARPSIDPMLGTGKGANSVIESFEVTRTPQASAGLPAGPVQLLERRADGALSLLGESRLFDPATRFATVDTISLGTADGVTGARERRELTVDEDNRKISEEFVISIENKRSHPVEVVLREHLYRGQNWTLAYQSADAPTQEGSQQISLRTTAPAHGTAKVLYVVVYTGL